MLCLGYDLLWVKTKLSWLFADCKRHCVPSNVRLQTDQVREMGRFFVYLSIYFWMSSKLSWIQICITCSDFELGSCCRVGCAVNGGLAYVDQRSVPTDVMVPSNLCYLMTLHWVQGHVAADHGALFQATSTLLLLKYRNTWVSVFLNSP